MKNSLKNFISILKNKQISDKKFILIVLVSICFIYDFNNIIFKRPVGIHQWRNCVSASYPKEMLYGASFWEPKTENFATNDHSSRVMQLEFPLVYYIVSILYHIFGYQEFLFRLTNIIIGLIGLAALFKAVQYYVGNRVYAWFIPMLIFTSIIFIFYVSNFIPDATGLSIALVGFYFFTKFKFEKKDIYFVLAILFFITAGLLKAQALLLYFSTALILFLESVFNLRFKKGGEKIFPKPLKYYAGYLIGFAFFMGYYLYLVHYSKEHGGVTSVRLNRSGIWNLDYQTIADIWDLFVRRFKAGYFHSPKLVYLIGALMVHNLIFLKRYNKYLNIIMWSVFFQGLIVFNLVFFFSIGRCDYYQINNLVFLSLVMLNYFMFIKHKYPNAFNSIYLKLIIVALGIILINDGRNAIFKRYSDYFHYDTNRNNKRYADITPYLRSLGIEREDRVYYTPDPSINISLYMMNQLGNTDFGLPYSSKVKNIEYLKSKGLKYFILGDPKILDSDTELRNYIQSMEQIGKYRNVKIYSVE